MPKYIAVGSYSSGSWARLMRRMDDRVAMGRKFAESLGGSLECLYWEISTRSVYAIVDMPDSATMAAATTAITQTGAFKSVEAHELLTQDQLSEVLALAGDVARIYQVPGQADAPEIESQIRAGSRVHTG
jgi:uncharacterized protein with GYD domain